MSEEEKEIIEKLKKEDIENTLETMTDTFYLLSIKELKIVLNLIDNQQKEIISLKYNIGNLKARQEDMIHKDKIIEKIQELKTKIIGSHTGIYSVQIDILEELLEE